VTVFIKRSSNEFGAMEVEQMETAVQNPKKLLRNARIRYERVCEQLDVLNDEATKLESEMLWLQSVIKRPEVKGVQDTAGKSGG